MQTVISCCRRRTSDNCIETKRSFVYDAVLGLFVGTPGVQFGCTMLYYEKGVGVDMGLPLAHSATGDLCQLDVASPGLKCVNIEQAC